jgi:hypothetical protein
MSGLKNLINSIMGDSNSRIALALTTATVVCLGYTEMRFQMQRDREELQERRDAEQSERTLEATYRLTLPKTYNSGAPISESEFDIVAKRMTTQFGGVSMYENTGYWLNDAGELQIEHNLVFASSRNCDAADCSRQNSADARFVHGLGNEYRQKLGQTAVFERTSFGRVNLITGKRTDDESLELRANNQ